MDVASSLSDSPLYPIGQLDLSMNPNSRWPWEQFNTHLDEYIDEPRLGQSLVKH